MQAWFGPENMTVPHCEVDARVGGKYRVELHSPSGAVHIVTGEFKEIHPPERLVYTWGWLEGAGRGPETLVTLTFASRDGGTDLTLEQSGFLTDDSRDRHAHGWNSKSCRTRRDARRQDEADNADANHRRRLSLVLRSLGSHRVRGKGHRLRGRDRKPAVAREFSRSILSARSRRYRCGDLTLYETSAILRYLDENFAGTRAYACERGRARHSRAMDQRPQFRGLSRDDPWLCPAVSVPALGPRESPTARRSTRRSRKFAKSLALSISAIGETRTLLSATPSVWRTSS